MMILTAVTAALVLWAIFIYNNLIKNRNMVEEGWSGIEVQLKRRANLIPNLVETVKGYVTHEREVLDEITELRTRSANAAGGPGAMGATEGMLGAALGRLFAVVENYPDLKADQNFIELHKSLDEVEEQIQLSRRYYNGAVRNLNIMVQAFPSNLIARQFDFIEAEFFELDNESDRAVPDISFSQ